MENLKVSFRIHRITETEFSYREPDLNVQKLAASKEVKFTIDSDFKWNIEENLFAVFLKIRCFIERDNTKKEENINLFSVSTLNEFYVDNLSKILQIPEDNSFQMNDTVLATLIGLSMSTARGVIVSRTAGSWVNHFFLPIINPNDYLNSIKPNIKVNTLENEAQ